MPTITPTIKLERLLGEHCITHDQGEVLYNLINSLLALSSQNIIIDIENVKFTAVFLNAAVAPYYALYYEGKLKFENAGETQQNILNNIFENAKEYYEDDVYREAVDITVKKLSEEGNQ